MHEREQEFMEIGGDALDDRSLSDVGAFDHKTGWRKEVIHMDINNWWWNTGKGSKEGEKGGLMWRNIHFWHTAGELSVEVQWKMKSDIGDLALPYMYTKEKNLNRSFQFQHYH